MKWGWSILALVLLCTGCAVGPNYKRPKTKVPEKWSHESHSTASLKEWWKKFDDPKLDVLVNQAIFSNLDLKIASARIRQARAERRAVSSHFYPQIDGNVSFTDINYSKNIAPLALFGTPGSLSEAVAPSLHFHYFQIGFDATWELDIFGGTRRAVEAAVANIEAEQEKQRNVLVSLLADVARNYIELRCAQASLKVVQEQVESQEKQVSLAKTKYEKGLVPSQTVASSKANLTQIRAQIPTWESAIKQSMHQIALLLGMEPTALIEFLHEAQPIPPVPPEIPLGIPSEILRRRPDIRAAERKLATVTAEIGVAVAALFPRFALTGEYFLQASTLSRLFQWNSSTWMINPGMTFPIFHGGRLWANIDIQKARHEHELAEYQRTVLTALTDVENAIVAYSKEKERYHALAETVEANRRVHHLTKDRYDKGLGSLVEVINAQQPLFESEKALTDSQETLTLHLVALYKALGGGWEEFIPPHKPSQVGSSKLNHKKSLRHKK